MVTRWSSMHCPSCNSRLGRRLDLQSFVTGNVVMLLGLPIVIFEMPIVLNILVFAAAVAIAYVLDVQTVKLVAK